MRRDYTSKCSSAARIERSIHKYKVVVGCMVCMAVVLGALLLHGAIKALYNTRSVFTVLYTLGFCVLWATPLLIWNSCNYLRYLEQAGRGNYFPGGPLDIDDRNYPESRTEKIEGDSLDLEMHWRVSSKSLDTTGKDGNGVVPTVSSGKEDEQSQPLLQIVNVQESCCSRNYAKSEGGIVQGSCSRT